MPVTTTNYTVGYTHTLTPNLVNDFRVGRNFLNTATLNSFATNGQKSAGTNLGIPGFTGDSQYNNPGIPDFNITGFNGLGNAGTQLVPERQHRTSFPNSSVGPTARTTSWREWNSAGWPPAAPPSTAPRGAFTFNGTLTGYAPADFILGTAAKLRHGRAGSPRTRPPNGAMASSCSTNGRSRANSP